RWTDAATTPRPAAYCDYDNPSPARSAGTRRPGTPTPPPPIHYPPPTGSDQTNAPSSAPRPCSAPTTSTRPTPPSRPCPTTPPPTPTPPGGRQAPAPEGTRTSRESGSVCEPSTRSPGRRFRKHASGYCRARRPMKEAQMSSPNEQEPPTLD